MTKNKPFTIVANWKMNGNNASSKDLTLAVSNFVESQKITSKIIVAPPSLYLKEVYNHKSNLVALAAQNCHDQVTGAYTGEISALMLKGIGCDYVILGHSERRSLFNEDDQFISRKAYQAIEFGLTPIICVGETMQQKEDEKAFEVISSQLSGSIPENANKTNCLIAYEPVWAIGSGLIPEESHISEMHKHIKNHSDMPVLYGGSVKSSNCVAIKSISNVDGLLVGGASLKKDEFCKIIAE